MTRILQAILFYTIGNNFKKGDMLMPKLLWRIGAVMLLMCGGFIFLFYCCFANDGSAIQTFFLDARVRDLAFFY